MLFHVPIPILLYPETHFRFFRLFPSLLHRKMPEIVFDAPRRVGPGHHIPIILIVNDIDRFPVEIDTIEIALSKKNHATRTYRFGDIQSHAITHPLSSQQSVFVFPIHRKEIDPGLCFINCVARIKRNKKKDVVINDNFPGSSKLPFSCCISDTALPGNEYVAYGDMHVHSHYSQSHVEFGTPISIIELFSNCCGNDFSVITDHSYDLACALDNYLKIDPSLSRWTSFLSECSKSVSKKPLILGEEISCLNSRGKAIHLCGIGIKEFVPGSIDGARKNASKAETLTLKKAIDSVHLQAGIAYAAHPGSTMGFMQRHFLKRGNWNQEGFSQNLDGIQAINNGFGKTWTKAKSFWVKELLKGHKLPLLGGNDSHGDFNRYRFLSIPFLSIQENFSRFFSCTKTGIYGKTSSNQSLLEAIKNGKTFVTTGPVLGMSLTDSLGDSVVSNKEIDPCAKDITVLLISNCEFGFPYHVRVFFGRLHESKEKLFFSKYFKNQKFHERCKIPIATIAGKGFLRAEAEYITSDGSTHYAVTSPCYFNNTLHND
jgi:hypothetical protein